MFRGFRGGLGFRGLGRFEKQQKVVRMTVLVMAILLVRVVNATAAPGHQKNGSASTDHSCHSSEQQKHL